MADRTYTLRVLHLSDLHEQAETVWMPAWHRAEIRAGAASRHRVLEESNFWSVLAQLGDQGVDLVCLTGDVADWGAAEEYAKANTLIAAILDCLRVGPERFFVVPGNHDVRRDRFPDSWRETREMARENPKAVGMWLAGGRRPPHADIGLVEEALARSQEFWAWVKGELGRPELRPGAEGYGRLGYRVMLRGLKTTQGILPFDVHVVGLDSAWLAGDENDAGKILITEAQAKLLLRAPDGSRLGGFRMGLVHHPPGLLADHLECAHWLEGGIDVLLCGHSHDELAQQYMLTDHPFQVLGAGALYEAHKGHHWENSFQLLTTTLTAKGSPVSVRRDRWIWAADCWIWERGKEPQSVEIKPKAAFIGRRAELEVLGAALVPSPGRSGPCAVCSVHGMAGVGKSWLVDQFYLTHRHVFGHMLRVPLGPEESVSGVLQRMANYLPPVTYGGSHASALSSVLSSTRSLVHLENVDSRDLARVATEVTESLPLAPMVISGRYAFAPGARWRALRLEPFDLEGGWEQLLMELTDESLGCVSKKEGLRLVDQVGGLPLAIHLAAGYMNAGYTIDTFLQRLSAQKLSVGAFSVNDLDYPGRHTTVLAATFELSLQILEASLPPGIGLDDYLALSLLPRDGFSLDMAAAAAGLTEYLTADLLTTSRSLSLLDTLPGDRADGLVWNCHPLLAQYLSARMEDRVRVDVRARLGAWFERGTAEEGDESRGVILGGLTMSDVEAATLGGVQLLTKRLLDVGFAATSLLLMAPVLGVVAVATKLTSPGPVFFHQERVGRNGRHFQMLRFRTMVQDTEERLARLEDHNDAEGNLFKMRGDPRLTRVGAFLRRWSLDEFPQFWNVLRGDMSIVGPRPPLPREVEVYDTQHYARLRGTPGITGLWQASTRGDLTFDEMVKLDVFYLDNWSLRLDFRIVLRTLALVFRRPWQR